MTANIISIDVSGLKNLATYMQGSPDAARSAMSGALNGAIKFAYAESSRHIRAQINVSQAYVGTVASGNKLKIKQYATKDTLLAVIRATMRPTSLARYAKDKTLFGKKGVDIEVKPGNSEHLKGAFLLPLKAGNELNEETFNIGLAIRLKPGQTMYNKRKVVQYSKGDPNLYLLYGPSVDQVFRQVRDLVEPAVTAFFASEFYRLFAVRNQA